MVEKYFSSKKSKVIQISVTYPKMSFQLLLSAENGLFKEKGNFFGQLSDKSLDLGSQPHGTTHIYIEVTDASWEQIVGNRNSETC